MGRTLTAAAVTQTLLCLLLTILLEEWLRQATARDPMHKNNFLNAVWAICRGAELIVITILKMVY
jgi:hypothetical protein